MKKLCIGLLVMILLIGLLGCAQLKYSEEDFIGLTSKEITDKYGAFDHTHNSPSDGGLYRNTSCGYMIKEARKGFMDRIPEEYFMISFDKDGIAYECFYQKGRPGG